MRSSYYMPIQQMRSGQHICSRREELKAHTQALPCQCGINTKSASFCETAIAAIAFSIDVSAEKQCASFNKCNVCPSFVVFLHWLSSGCNSPMCNFGKGVLVPTNREACGRRTLSHDERLTMSRRGLKVGSLSEVLLLNCGGGYERTGKLADDENGKRCKAGQDVRTH